MPAAIEALTAQVEALTNQVEVLRQVLDEVREDLQWVLQNDKLGRASTPCQPVRVTSMSKDPCAADWEINRVSPDDLPELEASGTPLPEQAELW